LRRYLDTGAVTGPKTGPFHRAVLGDPDALVLDVWISRALGVPQEALTRKDVRAKAVARFGAVARSLGWSVAETQAAVWTSVVRTLKDARGRRTYTKAPSLATLLRAELARVVVPRG